MRRPWKAVLAVLASAGMLSAEYGLFQIAEVPTTPRSSALGGAGTALAGSGFGRYNPALPAFADAPFLSCEFGREPGELSKAGIESSWMFPRWFAGASLYVRSTGFFVTDERTDESTMNLASSANQALQAAVTGGYVFGRLAAGGSVTFLEERVGDKAWHAFTFSPGVLFELVPNSVTLGASLSHYLRFDTAGSPWYRTPLAWYRSARGFPRYARAGVAWRDTVRRWSMPFTAACDFVYSDVYERLMAPAGAEVWVLPYLAARAGVCINHPSEVVHFGAGIRYQNMRFDFDYGISHAVSDVESRWLFGLSYALKKSKGPPADTAPGTPVPVNAVMPPVPAGPDTSAVPVEEQALGAPDSTVGDSTRVLPVPAPDSLLPPAGAGDTLPE